MKIANSIIELIVNTAMVRLNRVTTGVACDVFVKLEYQNPSGSIKDRIAKYMIEDAEKKGILHPGSTIVEASSGNTAIAFSLVAAMKGYRMKVFMPKLVSEHEKLKSRWSNESRLSQKIIISILNELENPQRVANKLFKIQQKKIDELSERVEKLERDLDYYIKEYPEQLKKLEGSALPLSTTSEMYDSSSKVVVASSL